MLKEDFESRRSKVVPLWSTSSTDVSSSSFKSSIRNVKCLGTEKYLSLCPFDADKACDSRRKVFVQCAKCTPDDLVNLLKSVEVGRNSLESSANANAALNRLKSQCYDWDCSANADKKYSEYCEVKAALEQAALYLDVKVGCHFSLGFKK